MADIAACDEVQLAAQAVCLDEMNGRRVAEGAIYYARSKRRREVPVTDLLGAQVVVFASAVRTMLAIRDFSAYAVTFDGRAVAVGESLQAAPGVTLTRRC